MNYKLTTLIKLAVCATLALGSIRPATADEKAPAAPAAPATATATGTWTWTMPGRNGGAERKFSLALKQDGEKLTGKLSAPGRDGAVTEIEIADGSVKGADVAFSATREYNGNKMTSKYSGKLEADAIKGKIDSKDREGNDQSRDWNAKRDAAK